MITLPNFSSRYGHVRHRVLGQCPQLAGKNDEARATFTRAIEAMKPTPDSVVVVDARRLPCHLAWAYAGLGEKEKALE